MWLPRDVNGKGSGEGGGEGCDYYWVIFYDLSGGG